MKNLLLFLLLLMLIGCKDQKNIIHKSTDGSVKEYNNWFAKDENFDKPEYKEKFHKDFHDAIKQKNFKKSSELLVSVIDIIINRGIYDEDYIKTLRNYIEKYEPILYKDDVFIFYVYLGEYEHYNTNYKKSIEILQKITSLEPYNYCTYTELGNAYYYIASSHSYLGDIEKALDDIEKAIACFNKTNDDYGKALMYHKKATICFDTNNTKDAIKFIDKTTNIYKKINYIEGLAPAMINKYDYLLESYPEKSNLYLDSIGNYINKGLVKDEQTLIHYNILKLGKYLKEKNIKELDQLIPEMDLQVKKINAQYWEYMVEMDKSKYQLLKYNKILNKDKLLTILESYKKNEEISYPNYILNTLKDEAIANNNLAKILEYDKEIDEYEKKIQKKDFQFKVKTYEKKIDVAKKEKLIAQQKSVISNNRLLILSLLIALLTIVFGTVLYYYRKRKKEAQAETIRQEQFTFQLLQNTEEERSRIAGELHDSVNHDLLNIKNNLINGKTIAVVDVANVIEEVRNISRNLHPAVLETVGLEASIENLCERITEIGLFATCDIEYTQKLTKNKELQLYRIIQEALNNTLKHGKANAAKVILTSQNNSLHLEVKDNGSGFDVNQQLKNPKSFGLQSIMQRAKAIAAKINIDSSTKGTIIFLKIPL